MRAKIFVAAPTGWDVNPYTYGSFAYNLAQLYKYVDVEITEPQMYDDRPLSVARNKIGEDLLKSDCTYVLTHDIDQVFPPGTFVSLVESALEVDAGIVCGWSMARKKGLPVLLVIKRFEDQGELCDPDNFSYYEPMSLRKFFSSPTVKTGRGTLAQVDGVGFGLVLIKRDVLERMERPWFLEWSPVMKGDVKEFGEDLWFCDRAAQIGEPVYVNLSCFMGHWSKGGVVIGWPHVQKKGMEEGIFDLDLANYR